MSSYYKIRKIDDSDNARDVQDICTQERINALCYVLDYQISLSKDDLLREASKAMNFTRVGVNVQGAFDASINTLIQQEMIESDMNGHYLLSAKGIAYAAKAKGSSKS